MTAAAGDRAPHSISAALPTTTGRTGLAVADVWLAEFRVVISGAVEHIFDERSFVTTAYDEIAADVHQSLRDFLVRSSGLAAPFAMAVIRGAGGDWHAAGRIAASLELLAGAILITDDMLDCDNLRWGAPSFHSRYAALARERGWRDDERFGRGIASVAADLLTSLAYGALASAVVADDLRRDIFAIVSTGQWRTDLSQLVDLRFEHILPKGRDWEKMAINRAAAHLQTSLHIAALLASLGQDEIRRLLSAGNSLGLIYDMRADLLDTFGRATPRRVIGRDLRMRKKPLFICAAADLASTEERQRLETMFEADAVPIAEIIRFARPKGVQAAVERIAVCARAATEEFAQTSLSHEGKQFFREMIERASSVGHLVAGR